jgi:hypothetical protein
MIAHFFFEIEFCKQLLLVFSPLMACTHPNHLRANTYICAVLGFTTISASQWPLYVPIFEFY